MELAREPHPLIIRLKSITDLSPQERDALLHLPLTIREVAPDQDIVREGDRPSECCLILSGMACRYKVTEGGKRQIMSFHVAGEIPDLQSLHLRTMDHSLSTLTPCKLAFIAHQVLHGLFAQHPRLIGGVLARDPDRCGDLPRVGDQCRAASGADPAWRICCVSCSCGTRRSGL